MRITRRRVPHCGAGRGAWGRHRGGWNSGDGGGDDIFESCCNGLMLGPRGGPYHKGPDVPPDLAARSILPSVLRSHAVF